MKRTHELKTRPAYFDAIRSRDKKFDVRRDDRGFQKGDTLVLREWSPERVGYTGNEERRTIKYVLTGGQLGIEPGYVVLGF